ncbi:MAG TPA: LLM class flavin-dependent oxidoreductase, partial [Thermomicrobiales bacterium]|nr:LLM class flavin-dependent oxidoreductase [Thermomicrobiales bacterium]
PIYVATSGPIMAGRTGKHTDGIITVGAADEKLNMLIDRFEKGAKEAGKDPATMPRMLQIKVSFAESEDEAIEQAVREWPNGGMPFPKADIRNPEDFEAMSKLVRPENFKNRVLMSPDLDEHAAQIQHYIDLGFGEIYVHNVGRNQEAFITAYGERVIPKLTWPD